MSSLFSPLTIKGLTLRNRVVVSPMCQYSATDGFANDWHLVHLGAMAVGGAALVFVEATGVSPEARITPGCLGIWRDEHIDMLRRIAVFIEQQGAVPGIQLAHAGRKASHDLPWKGAAQLKEEEGGWTTVAPSAIAFSEGEVPPIALDNAGIKKVVEDFSNATQRAMEAGFKIVEIHAAHGYLLNEFLSPLSNQRTDEYGGSFDNRIRLLLEVIEAVQKVWPKSLPLFVRISATDWVEGGWTINDSVKLGTILKEKGVDLIDCSSGGNDASARIPLQPGYQVRFAEAVRQTGIMTGAVGLITEAKQAESIIREGKADLVFLAREMLRNPHFVYYAANELDAEHQWPNQYLRARFKK